MISRVKSVVQDLSVANSTDVTAWLNDGLEDATFRVDIPQFRTNAEVVTVVGQTWISLPTSYQRGLYFGVNVTEKKPVVVCIDLKSILSLFPLLDQVGPVKYVAEDGGRLNYQPVPTTEETLRLYFYRKPTRLIADGDEPENIPAHLHEQILVFYAAAKGWDLIEQGVAEQKKNFMAYFQQYELGLKKLRNAVTSRGSDFSA
jgi:hypothetical protein